MTGDHLAFFTVFDWISIQTLRFVTPGGQPVSLSPPLVL
jgi:hypothetical protein